MSSTPLELRAGTAVLVMDYQPDILDRVAADAPALLETATSVITAARAANVPVMYVTVAFRPGYPEVHPRNAAFATLAATGRMIVGTPGASVHPALAPRDDEPVIVKHRVGAFFETDLATLLRAKGIDTLVLLGISTSGVVLSTLRYAADADFRVIVVADGCADGNAAAHRALLDHVFPRQATVTDATTVIAALR